MKVRALASFALISIAPIAATADVCDYRPSALIGQGVSGAAAAVGGAAAGAGVGMKTAGFYTLVHASSGLTMLGSTMAGASAAGTVGIIAGTGGVIGTVGAVLLAPVTIIVGGIAFVGISSMEAACYFTDERITDYDSILNFMKHLAEHHPEDRFQLVRGIPGRQDDFVRIWNAEKERLDKYMVSKLYIVNGTLMYRKWGPNRSLGYIARIKAEE